MSSAPQRIASQDKGALPFASYAQIVRMLIPLTDKVGFYDAQGVALWISDGVEEPGLRTGVEVMLAQFAGKRVNEPQLDYIAGGQAAPTFVLPIQDSSRRLLGAMGVVCRAAADSAHRRLGAVEKLLAPLLEILGDSWRAPATDPTPHASRSSSAAAGAGAAAPSTPSPAVLRRTLALAVQRIECAFGAVVAADRPFTLTHRTSPDESDVATGAVIDTVSSHMLKLMRVRREPLIANGAGHGRAASAPYKFIVFPVQSRSGRLVALIMLFRNAHDRDFVPWDVEALADIAKELSDDVLEELARAPADGDAAPEAPAPQATHAPRDISEPTRAAPAPRDISEPTRVAPAPRNISEPTRVAPAPPRIALTRVQPITMDARIRMALRDGAFDLYAQKISALRGAPRPERFEVLLRMHDADKIRAPHAFFAAAEMGSLMPDLDRWVIRNLLQMLRRRSDAVRAGRWEFCINIAAQSMVSDAFREFVVAEVCRSSIPASLLVFEFSESNALEHQDAVEIMAARLRDVGCRIALDNCRSGFDTLSTLRRWPVSCVKIDGSLIRDVVDNPRSEALVRAVVELAGGIGIETVAECVETADIRGKLLDIGVDYAQGFHLGAPQPIERFFSG
jgi:EAL domain-containing protein (putative c-di-GMP-specific phosphodiesterase class I)